MKKVLFLFAAMLLTFACYAKGEDDATVTFRINPPMSCANCESKIKSNLRFEKGVTAIEAEAPNDVVTVKYNTKKTDVDNIVKAFSKLGYEAVPCVEEPVCNSPKVCPEENCNSGNPSCGGCNGGGNCCQEGK